MDRRNLLRVLTTEQLDEELRPLLADQRGEHHFLLDRRGHARNNLNEITTWVQVVDEHGVLNVFADECRVVAPPVEAPANPQTRRPAPNAEDAEGLGIILALASAVSLPREIEREGEAIWDTNDDDEDTNDDDDDDTVTHPATVDAGLVSTVHMVDNGDGSGPKLASTLEVRVARQTK